MVWVFFRRFKGLLGGLLLGLACEPATLFADAAADLFNSAQNEMVAGRYQQAAQGFKFIIDTYPASTSTVAAHAPLGLCQFYTGDYAAAIASLKKVAEDAQMPKEWKERAQFYLAQSVSAQAFLQKGEEQKKGFASTQQAYEEFLKKYPQSQFVEEVYYGQALVCAQTGAHQEAIQKLAEMDKKYPSGNKKGDGMILLGNIYGLQSQALLSGGKTSEANAMLQKSREVFQKITSLSSVSPDLVNEAFLQSGELLSASGKHAEAAGLFKKVISKQRMEDVLKKGVDEKMAAIRAQPAKRETLLEEKRVLESKLAALKNRPDPRVTALGKVAFCMVQMQAFDEARAIANHLLKFASEQQKKTLLSHRALSLILQGKLPQAEEAVARYKQASGSSAGGDNLLIMLGNQHLSKGNAAAALACFEKSLSEDAQGRFTDEAGLCAGAALFQLGRLDDAKKRFAAYIEKNRGKKEAESAQLQLAALCIQTQKPQEALVMLEELVAKSKDSAIKEDALFRIGFALSALQKKDEASQAHKKFVQSYPQSPNAPKALFAAAQCLEGGSKSVEAMPLYQQVLKSYAKDEVAPYAQQAVAFQHLNAKPPRATDAFKAFEELVNNYPDSPLAPPSLFYQASILSQTGRAEEAAQKYRYVIERHAGQPVAADALLALARMQARHLQSLGNYLALDEKEKSGWEQKWDAAFSTLSSILKQYPSSPSTGQALSEMVKLQTVRVKAEKQTFAESVAVFAKLAETADTPDLKAKIAFAQAGLIYESGETASALVIMDKAYSQNPTARFSHDDLDRFGVGLLAASRFKEALDVFERLLREAKQNPHGQAAAYYGLGIAHLNMGNSNEAKKWLEKLSADCPWSEKIHHANYSLAKTKETLLPDEAIKLYEQIIEARPQTPIPRLKADAMWDAGAILEKKAPRLSDAKNRSDMLARAAGYYEMIDTFIGVLAGDKAPEGLWKAGQLYEQAEKPQDARRSYKSLVDAYANHALAQQASARLAALPTPPPTNGGKSKSQ